MAGEISGEATGRLLALDRPKCRQRSGADRPTPTRGPRLDRPGRLVLSQECLCGLAWFLRRWATSFSLGIAPAVRWRYARAGCAETVRIC